MHVSKSHGRLELSQLLACRGPHALASERLLADHHYFRTTITSGPPLLPACCDARAHTHTHTHTHTPRSGAKAHPGRQDMETCPCARTSYRQTPFAPSSPLPPLPTQRNRYKAERNRQKARREYRQCARVHVQEDTCEHAHGRSMSMLLHHDMSMLLQHERAGRHM